MVSPLISEVQPSSPEAGVVPLYAIDPARFEASGRSFWSVASRRFCRSCQRKYGVVAEEEGARSKRPAKVAKAPEPLKVIQECCSKTAGYLNSSLPVAEAMFRVLLARGNKPIDPVEMQSRLEAWAAAGERRCDLSVTAVRRILDNLGFYNIRRVRSEGAPPAKGA